MYICTFESFNFKLEEIIFSVQHVCYFNLLLTSEKFVLGQVAFLKCFFPCMTEVRFRSYAWGYEIQGQHVWVHEYTFVQLYLCIAVPRQPYRSVSRNRARNTESTSRVGFFISDFVSKMLQNSDVFTPKIALFKNPSSISIQLIVLIYKINSY